MTYYTVFLEKLEASMSKKQTPMMDQYFSIKDKYKEGLLFFRLGDFYELVFMTML